MMMEQERNGWRAANEDALSTCSSGSDPERNLNSPTGSSSESILLRMPNVRRVVSSQAKPKAAITALAFTVLLVISGVFGTLYFSSGSGNEDATKSAVSLTDHNVFVRDLEDLDTEVHSNGDKLLLKANSEEDPEPPLALPRVQQDPDSTSPSSNATTTPRRRKPKNRNRSGGANHGPRRLPVDAQEKPPFSLLNQMKLVHGRQESYVNYTKCEDEDLDGRKLFKGWKAVVPVNLTAVGITADHPNTYTGYGRTHADARRRAAEIALTTLYPGKLEYAGMNDLQEIDQYCTIPHTTTR